MTDKYADRVYEVDKVFESTDEIEQYFSTEAFVKFCKAEFGRELPYLFRFTLKDNKYVFATPEGGIRKQGIPMDWRFYAEFDPITEADITAEQNIEKRRLLMMEFGIANYLKGVKILDSSSYGTLIEAQVEGEPQRFVKVINGTKEPEENQAYLKERGMLTKDGYKIYYIPVGEEVDTAKEGIEWSWGLAKDVLPAKGWDEEA